MYRVIYIYMYFMWKAVSEVHKVLHWEYFIYISMHFYPSDIVSCHQHNNVLSTRLAKHHWTLCIQYKYSPAFWPLGYHVFPASYKQGIDYFICWGLPLAISMIILIRMISVTDSSRQLLRIAYLWLHHLGKSVLNLGFSWSFEDHRTFTEEGWSVQMVLVVNNSFSKIKLLPFLAKMHVVWKMFSKIFGFEPMARSHSLFPS